MGVTKIFWGFSKKQQNFEVPVIYADALHWLASAVNSANYTVTDIYGNVFLHICIYKKLFYFLLSLNYTSYILQVSCFTLKFVLANRRILKMDLIYGLSTYCYLMPDVLFLNCQNFWKKIIIYWYKFYKLTYS